MNDAFAMNYIHDLCNQITGDVQETIVKSVMEKNPNIDKQALKLYVEENVIEKQKTLEKSAIKVYQEFKKNLTNKEGQDMNDFIQNYM